MLTDLRRDGRRGSRDWTAVGRMEDRIEGDFGRGAKSAESGRGLFAVRAIVLKILR